MKRALTSDDMLRPLSPADLRGNYVPAGTAVVCAEPGCRVVAESVTGVLRRHGWTSSVDTDLDRARWLASVRQIHAVVIAGSTAKWTIQAVMTNRLTTTVPILVLADFGFEVHPRLFEAGADIVGMSRANDAWLISAVAARVPPHPPGPPPARHVDWHGLPPDLPS